MEPIHPGRTCGTPLPMEIDFCPSGSPEKRTRRVKGCYLAYEFRAEDFAPGEPLELRILPEGGEGPPTILPVDGPLRDRIWADFEPYREVTQAR